jgi:hypothetical protein
MEEERVISDRIKLDIKQEEKKCSGQEKRKASMKSEKNGKKRNSLKDDIWIKLSPKNLLNLRQGFFQ